MVRRIQTAKWIKCSYENNGRTTLATRLEKKVNDFYSYLEIKKTNVKPENFINMDEVPVGNRTFDLRGAEDISFNTTGAEKTRFTLVFAVSAAGEKLKPMVIFKQKTCPKGKFLPVIIVKANPKGWINAELMQGWMDVVWKKRKNAFF